MKLTKKDLDWIRNRALALYQEKSVTDLDPQQFTTVTYVRAIRDLLNNKGINLDIEYTAVGYVVVDTPNDNI